MVTLKNGEGGDLTMDNTIKIDYKNDEANGASTNQAKATLSYRKNSHHFEDRTLTLDQPVKIGRSVARSRPLPTNGIFDCKVLSRNHALIWYNDGKFFIQDTKSSNGTFVNNQRLSKGAEDSPPREIFSGDIVQFGVDVLENQRKVTHGCIVATVKLYFPNGEEAKSSQFTSASIPQEDICKLQQIIYEAQQREERLHDKLVELQGVIKKLDIECQETLTYHFEETRLLSRIENLEKQAKLISKIRPGSMEKAEIEIQQLLQNVEKVQGASREIQERLHKKLLQREQELADTERVASNLKLEVTLLREQDTRNEECVQELATKCTAYNQTIEELKSKLAAQIELNKSLELQIESRREEYQRREVDFQNQLDKILSGGDKIISAKLILEDYDDDFPRKEKANEEIILERLEKSSLEHLEESDRVNEDDLGETMRDKIEELKERVQAFVQGISSATAEFLTARVEYKKTQKELVKFFYRKQELLEELERARSPVINDVCNSEFDNNDKSKNFEKIAQLENELKDLDEVSSEVIITNKENEERYQKRKSELNAAINSCRKIDIELCTVRTKMNNQPDWLNTSPEKLLTKIDHLECELSAKEKMSESQEIVSVEPLMKHKDTQTAVVEVSSIETNTDELIINLSTITTCVLPESSFVENSAKLNELKDEQLVSSHTTDSTTEHVAEAEGEIDIEHVEQEDVKKDETDQGDLRLDDLSMSSLTLRQKIRNIQDWVNDNENGSENACEDRLPIKVTVNSLADDVVHLLLREQEYQTEMRILKEKLNQSLTQADIAALGLANQFLALMVGVLLYYIGGKVLAFLGLLDR